MSAKVTFAGCGDAFGSGGRFNSCFVVDVQGLRYAIEFGASSLVALKQAGIEHSSIDVFVFSHIHICLWDREEYGSLYKYHDKLCQLLLLGVRYRS